VSLGEHDEGAVYGGDPEDSDAYRRYCALRTELQHYDAQLAERPEIVVLTKTDLAYNEDIDEAKALFERMTGRKVHVISAPTGQGLDALKAAILALLSAMEEE